MYLKSLMLKNYRKYNNQEGNIICFAHSSWEDNLETEQYISKSSSLVIGKNNSGKSTIVNLLTTLQNTKAGSKNVFKHSDFNLTYLREWYEKYVQNKTPEEINSIKSSDLPIMEFNLKIGIDSEDDYISNFQDILVISAIDNEDTDEVADIDIVVKYEITNEKLFLTKLADITEERKEININNLGLNKTKLGLNPEDDKINLNELRTIYDKCLEENDTIKLKSILDYYNESLYREFLQLLDTGYYTLNFYPLNSNQAAKSFSLAAFLKVKAIQANTVKDNNTLSTAYNKIVTTYAKKNGLPEINDFIDDINIRLKDEIDTNIEGILKRAATSIESNKNLEMNLHPDINLEKILGHSVLYEYKEDHNFIPEDQYGMGYTNLMVILAELVDYFEKYEEDDINGSINILCIEELETFMHPEMQELFIKKISEAISNLIPEDIINSDKDTFQIIITTHSSHILNSKIQYGNSLDNIVYLDAKSIINIDDKKIKSSLNISNKFEVFEYIKKFLRLELSDIFYADAVIIVEGQTEETYLRYLIDEDEQLSQHHIKVYRIDGAYGYRFISLLDLLQLKTIIITDLDINRTKEERESNKAIRDLATHVRNEWITTNETIKNIFSIIHGYETKETFNSALIEKIASEEFLKINYSDNIQLLSQGKIEGNYATSFEEAFVLTNSEGNKQEIINLLKEVHPCIFKELTQSNLIKKSYFIQTKLADAKSKFSNTLVYNLITKNDYKVQTPKYIQIALDSLKDYFGENR